MANINDIKTGISIALDSTFPNIEKYTESIEQGFDEPCFFIKVLSSSMDKELDRRYKKNVSIDIHYFSDKEDINSDCFNIADKLYEVLESVVINTNRFRSTKLKHEVIDGVLHFMMQFNHHVMKEIELQTKMENLEVKVNGK